MPYTNDAKHGMLDSLVNRATHVSIHTADPGTTGTNEQTGGGYARVAIASGDWAAASGGERATNTDKTFSGPSNGDATHFGLWDGSTFLGGGAITGDVLFNAEGVFVLQAGTKVDLNA